MAWLSPALCLGFAQQSAKPRLQHGPGQAENLVHLISRLLLGVRVQAPEPLAGVGADWRA
jgi:hypothetical protein